MGSGYSKKKKQAKQLQEQLAQMQQQMESAEATGSAGNGLVTITLTGDNSMKKIQIKPDCVDPEDIEGLEDLIQAAYKDAQKKLQEATPQMPNMGAMGGGFPGLGL